jgi:pyruvate dehydrogenase E1 component beta subunit
MDYDTILTSVKKTNRLVVLEEGLSLVSLRRLLISFKNVLSTLDAPIQRITTADTPAPYSPVLKEWLPNADDDQSG